MNNASVCQAYVKLININVLTISIILGDPGADSGGEGKSNRATENISEETSRTRGEQRFT